jgi:hypothetical protein
LLIDVGIASITVVGCFVPILLLVLLHFIDPLSHLTELIVVVAEFIPCGIAAVWLYRKIQTRYSKRDAKKVAIGFVVFTPISLAVALVLAPLGAYAEHLGRLFVLPGVFTGIVVILTLLNYLVSIFSLWVSRQP